MAAADHYICPACGCEVRVGASRCPNCDPPKPWEQDEGLDGLDLPDPEGDDEFDYESFAREEFGGFHLPRGKALMWGLVAVLLLLAFVALILQGR